MTWKRISRVGYQPLGAPREHHRCLRVDWPRPPGCGKNSEMDVMRLALIALVLSAAACTNDYGSYRFEPDAGVTVWATGGAPAYDAGTDSGVQATWGFVDAGN